jgi:ribosomal protein L20A (L18A)
MGSSEVKIFKISGKFVKKWQNLQFTKYVRAMKEKDALDQVLSVVTSNGILRRKIKITELKEVTKEECKDFYIQGLSNL